MSEGLWVVLIVLAGFAVYVAVKVFAYMRQSEAQWNQVDRSKLREWDDEEDD